jgi:hypothetical protein
MTAPIRARALLLAIVGLGGVIIGGASLRLTHVDAKLFALLAAAAILAEVIQVEDDPTAAGENEQHFSFSSGIHIASVLVLGPFIGALVAAAGVVVVDPSRGNPRSKVAFNAGMLAVSSFAAGCMFEVFGGHPGQLPLPSAFGAVAAAALTLYVLSTLLVSSIVALMSGQPFGEVFPASFRAGSWTAVGEAGLGVALTVLLIRSPWAALALAPLLIALYQASAHLAKLRTETSRALETFAEVVDERDPTTFRHSARVAEYAQSFGNAIGLGLAASARLRLAGQLHDLGKIAVDIAILRKTGPLNDDEWEVMRRHPRLSARMVRSFSLAKEEAAAIEYHHERYDGNGYYGMDSEHVPMAAHVLTVADTYDAMTSDRPYRRGLSPAAAQEEILRGAGRQFHPAVAKAFVAMQRGEDALAELTDEERVALQALNERPRRRMQLPRLASREALGVAANAALAASFGLAFYGEVVIGLLIAAPAAAILVLRVADARRRRDLEAALRAIAGGALSRDRMFDSVVALLAGTATVTWGALARWDDRALDAHFELLWDPHDDAPAEADVAAFLAAADERSGSRVAAEAPGRGTCVAIPLRGDDQVSSRWLLLAFDGGARHVALDAVRRAADVIATALEAPPRVAPTDTRQRIALVG